MPGKKGGKGKRKGGKKRFQGPQEIATRDKVLEDLNKSIGTSTNNIWYARVEKIHSGDRIRVTCYCEKDNTGTHRTEIVDAYVKKNLRRNRPKKGDYLLIQSRAFNQSEFDAVLFYKPEEVKKLIKWKEIPLDTVASNIVFITNDEDDDNDGKPLTREQKRKLRLQINTGRDEDYINMDNLFSSEPGNNSIYTNFLDDETEEGQKLLNDAIADIKEKSNSQDIDSSSEDSDEDIDVIVDDNLSDADEFI
jgi:hypothetical protein